MEVVNEKKTPKVISDLSARQKAKYLRQEMHSNKIINKQLQLDHKKLNNEFIVLLLGSSEAGKSTFLKQLRLLHVSSFEEDERLLYIAIARTNVINGLQAVLKAAHLKGLPFGDFESMAEEMAQLKTPHEQLFVYLPDVMTLLHSDPIKVILTDISPFPIPDATPYFLCNAERIAAPNYKPTDKDIIMSRVMTTSIIEYKFNIEGNPFKFIDVTGQKSKRNKWFSFFADVTVMLFVASLSNYNQTLWEDNTENAMMDQLKLFDSLINGEYFRETSVILLLNKKDLFQEKIKSVPLTVCFPEYEKPEESEGWEDAAQYIEDQFLGRNKNPFKVIHTHFLTATDGQSVQLVFKTVHEIIMRSMLSNYD